MTAEFLDAEEVARLTRKTRWTAQCRALDAQGIRYRRAGRNHDGEPLVRRSDLDATSKAARQKGPRWHMIDA